MLKGTLDRLEGLLSRQFLIGYALPTLFLAILSLALYEIVLADRIGQAGWSLLAWYGALDAVLQAIVGLLGTIVFVTLTYVLALTAPVLRQVLEGRYYPDGMKAALRAVHRDRLWRLVEQRREVAALGVGMTHLESELGSTIRDARAAASPASPQPIDDDARQSLDLANQALGRVWQESDLSAAITARLPTAIERTGRAVAANLLARKTETEVLIGRLNDTAAHLRDRLTEADASSLKLRGEEFPRDLLAPTRLGNVAEAIRSRIFHVYGMDSDYFWPRLEVLLPDKNSLKQEILDGKAKLDAMVLLSFYAGLFTAVWLVLILLYGASHWLFLAIGLFGPLASVFFYWLAVRSYLVLGQSMRSAVDLYRFDLLKGLKADLPTDKKGERAAWTRLQKALVYGESDDLGYKHQ